MNDPLNLYGDKLSPSGSYGSNISDQRVDELDQAALDFVKTGVSEAGSCQVVELGGGSGAQSKRFAALGASVFMADMTDQSEALKPFPSIRFLQKDVRKIRAEEWPSSIDCVYSQRMLGYIPYNDSLHLMKLLRDHAQAETQFFISASGLETEYGSDYPDRTKPVEKRFARLSTDMAKKHGIHELKCLYRESELCELLVRAGLVIVQSWTSSFGNPKVIARR